MFRDAGNTSRSLDGKLADPSGAGRRGAKRLGPGGLVSGGLVSGGLVSGDLVSGNGDRNGVARSERSPVERSPVERSPVERSRLERSRLERSRLEQGSDAASVDAGSRACLVIGESGANWSAGIASARRHGPNLALVTQWVGEAPAHFCQRVLSRLSKRRAFASVVMVCNQRNDRCAAEARQLIIQASAGAMCAQGDRELTLICAPTQAGGIPHWAPQLAEYLPREDRPFGLTVELGAL